MAVLLPYPFFHSLSEANGQHFAITVLDPIGACRRRRGFPSLAKMVAPTRRTYAWMHADDSLVRSERAFEAHYFHTNGSVLLDVPVGRSRPSEVDEGFRISLSRSGPCRSQPIKHRNDDPVESPRYSDAGHSRWVSGDVHVHMNYGGAYRNTPKNLVAQAEAENLSIVEDLIVNKEQRIPDIAYFRPTTVVCVMPASTASTLLFHGQEFHTSYWGHLGLLNLRPTLPYSGLLRLIPTLRQPAFLPPMQT